MRRLARPTRVVIVVALLTLLGVDLIMGDDLVRERRPIAGTGTPRPMFAETPVDLEPGSTACTQNVPLGPHTGLVEMYRIGSTEDPVDLAVDVHGDGWRAPPSRMEPGEPGPDANALRAPFEPPGRELIGEICVRNDGGNAVPLQATVEGRTTTARLTLVDGAAVTPDVALILREPETTTLLGYLPELVGRVAQLRGFLGAEWLVWLLVGSVVLLVPGGVLFALHRALRCDRDEPR
jgi:hypothetical protein